MRGNFISRPSFKKTNKSKLGIIICSSLEKETTNDFITEFVNLMSTEKINYKMFILNENSKYKNKGNLYNIGFNIAKENNCDYVIFQNDDFIPTQSIIGYYKTYPINPIDLSYHTSNNNMNVLSININDFENMNGFNSKTVNIKKEFIRSLNRNNIKINIPSSGSFKIHENNTLYKKGKLNRRKKNTNSIIETQILSDNIYYYIIG